MTIAPVVKIVDVKCPPARAFELFSQHMGEWWPRTMTLGASPMKSVAIEPRTGGRWCELGEDGGETQWGRVLEWSPPRRLLLAWQIGASWTYEATLETELELTFTDLSPGTRVRLEHRNLERLGDSAEKMAAQLGGGWPGIIEAFGAFADQHAHEGD